jgi:hypothetical protein
MERLEHTAQTLKANAIRDLAEMLRIERALTTAGIDHRFLKGAGLGIMAYGTPTLKHSWDIDVLVSPADAVRSARCLESLQYKPSLPARSLNTEEFARWSVVSKEAEFRSEQGTTVELHWKVSDNPHLLFDVAANGPAREVRVLGKLSILTLSDPQNLAYLAVHGFSHAWFRLKWLADFNAFSNMFNRNELYALRGAAMNMGVGDTLETAFALTARLFGSKCKSASSAGLDYSTRCIRALSSGDEREAERIAGGLRWWADPTWRYKLTEAKIRARGTLDRLIYPLPPRLQFLYPWLRLPFWLHRKLFRPQEVDESVGARNPK